MARTVDVGIRLLGTDVSATRTVKAVSNAFAMLHRAGSAALHIMTPLNQGLEVMRKVGRLVDLAIGGAVRAALALRPAGDAAAKAFDALEASAKGVYSALGEAFIPALQGMAQAFGPVLDGMRQWLAKNRELVASGFVSFLVGAAEVLIEGVTFALYETAKAISTFQRVWAGAAGTVAEFRLAFAEIFEFRKDIPELRDTVERLANAYDDAGVSADAFAERTAGVREQLMRVAEQARVTGQAVIASGLGGGTSRRAAAAAGPERKVDNGFVGPELELSPYGGDRIDLAAQQAYQTFARPGVAENMGIKVLNDDMGRLADSVADLGRSAAATGQEFGAMFGAIASGMLQGSDATKAFSALFVDTMLSAVQRAIDAWIAEAAVAAAASTAPLGPFALIAGPAIAGAVVGMLRGLVGGMLSAETGGQIRAPAGGTPVTLHDREVVVRAPVVEKIERMADGGRALTVNVNAWEPSKAEVTRHVRDVLVPELRALGWLRG